MELMICPDPDSPDQICEAATIVKELIDIGFLVVDLNESGDCHEAALNILTALVASGNANAGWNFAQGQCKEPTGWHSWLEFKGWAVDLSNGGALFAPIKVYYQLMSASGIQRFTPPKLAKKLGSKKGRKELRIT